MDRTFEQLESRRLMAGDFMIYEPILLEPIFLATPLTVEGTGYNDSIYISNDGLGNVVVNNNGVVSSHWANFVSKIVVNTYGGNDYVSTAWNINEVMEIRGGSGSDTLVGGNLNDIIEGGGETDSVYGQAGNDLVDGGVGGSAFYSENTGNDYVSGGAGADTVHASDWGSCTLDGGDGDDYVYGWNGNDTLYGSWGLDTMYGGAGNDKLFGYTGNDRLYGNDGDDLIRGEWDNDSLQGGNGNDTIHGDSGHDWVWGEAGNDKLYGGAGDDGILGGLGDDTIVTIGGGQYDCVWGEGGTDSIWTDAEATETINDYEPAYNIHRVGGFMEERFTNNSPWPWDWQYQTPSRELNGQNFRDPNGGSNYGNYSNQPLFNGTNPVPGDVRQGGLGDCYFLAPLSSVAKINPNTIRQSVVELGDGTYAVRFFSGGTQHFIRVDGDLPRNGWNNPSFAQLGTGNSTWVAIMEKAWAHFRGNQGSWQATESGWMDECYSALGKGTDTQNVDWWYKAWNNANDLWNYVSGQLGAGKSVTVGTHGSPNALMVGGHAYMVDSVYMSGTTRMVRLRNPWGYDGGSVTDSSPNDAYVTLTAQQLFDSISKVQSAYV